MECVVELFILYISEGILAKLQLYHFLMPTVANGIDRAAVVRTRHVNVGASFVQQLYYRNISSV